MPNKVKWLSSAPSLGFVFWMRKKLMKILLILSPLNIFCRQLSRTSEFATVRSGAYVCECAVSCIHTAQAQTGSLVLRIFMVISPSRLSRRPLPAVCTIAKKNHLCCKNADRLCLKIRRCRQTAISRICNERGRFCSVLGPTAEFMTIWQIIYKFRTIFMVLNGLLSQSTAYFLARLAWK